MLATAAAPGPSGTVQFATSQVEAPPADQLTGWEFLLAGASMTRAGWESLADDAVGIRGRVDDGDAAWVDTVVELESPFFAIEQRVACGVRYGTEIRASCSARFDIGIQRSTATRGRVVYTRVTALMDEEPVPERDVCELFLKCIAHAKLGGIVPIPDDAWADIVVYQLVGFRPSTDDLRNPEHLRAGAAMADDYQRELQRQIDEGETERTAAVQAKIQSLGLSARHARSVAVQLEQPSAP